MQDVAMMRLGPSEWSLEILLFADWANFIVT
jgi:hypothetical protein